MGKFSYQSKLKDIFNDEQGAKLIEAFAPGALNIAQVKKRGEITLETALGWKFLIKGYTGKSDHELDQLVKDILAIE